MYSRRQLADAFRTLGVAPGDTVMLHASVRSVGEVAGGPDEIHLALKDAPTAGGTLVMYAGCSDYTDEIGRGCHTPEVDRFAGAGGRILLLGCDHDHVTFLHYAEHIADIPDKRVAKFKVPVDEHGTRVWRDMEEFDSSGGARMPTGQTGSSLAWSTRT